MPESRLAWQPYLVMALGVFSVSWGAILVRLAAAPPLWVGALRLGIASLILTPLALATAGAELRRLRLGELGLIIVSGVFLGIHFATWISSLSYTSVASSVVLVSTTPLFVGLASRFLLGQKVADQMFIGIALATLGAAIIGWGDLQASGTALRGDALAVLGAMAVSVYLLIGRGLRQHLSLLAYVTPTYWVAAVVLGVALLGSGERLSGYPAGSYWAVLLLAIGPQILGHSSFNWALRHLSPTFVAAVILGEPIGSTVLAYLILREAPTSLEMLGGLVILIGIYLCGRAEASEGLA